MRNSDRIYAITGTVLFHALLLIALLFSFLRFPPEEVEEWPPEPKNEIVFDEMEELYAAGDFVRTGDNLNDYVPHDTEAPSSETSPEPTQDSPDASNSGMKADPAPTVTSEQPSPAKIEKKPKGPTKEEIAAEKARQEAKAAATDQENVDRSRPPVAFGGGRQGEIHPRLCRG